MAHRAQRQFCEEVRRRFPDAFRNAHVLEVGSLDINGSIRNAFVDCRHVGLDCRPGPGVDVVGLAHDYPGRDGEFDVVCALETFEHDPYAPQTVANMLRLLRPGGLFLMTCAGEGRPEHGTPRTGAEYGPLPAFYRNVGLPEFIGWMTSTGCELEELHVRRNRRPADLYAWAVKSPARAN
jgi:SAM-dependent methyltransferase